MEKGFSAGSGLALWRETRRGLFLQVPFRNYSYRCLFKLILQVLPQLTLTSAFSSFSFPFHICVHISLRFIFIFKNAQIMPTGEIGQARSHREVLSTPPSEVSHKQDLDTDPSQIRESQQVSQTEEMEAKTLPTRWRTVKAHRTSLKTFPPGSQWTKVAEPNKGMRTANSNLSKVLSLTPACHMIIMSNQTQL